MLAFCCGLALTVFVIIPARDGTGPLGRAIGEPPVEASPSVGVGPVARRTPVTPSPTPTYSTIIRTPTPRGSVSTPRASETVTPEQQPTTPPPPTSTPPRFPFFYVEGSRQEQENCVSQYLKGLVVDANGVGVDGVTIRYERWGVSEFYVSGSDPTAPRGHWTFDYMPDNKRMATDFILQVVDSAGNPAPLSERLVIHYSGCGAMGQITNIVFKQR